MKIVNQLFVLMFVLYLPATIFAGNVADSNMTVNGEVSNIVIDTSDSSTTNIKFSDTETGSWNLSYSPNEVIIIPMDGINIPIEINKPKLDLVHSDRGRFSFSGRSMVGLTHTPVLKNAIPQGTTFRFRPTLFVSIPGFNINSQTLDDWQYDLQTVISNLPSEDNVRNSQYKHYAVKWDSDEWAKKQIESFGEDLNDFLNNRSIPWDVVIIGHSRGAIFAHELAEEILGNSNIDHLHTILLDPTATIGFGGVNDFYPLYKRECSSCSNHYGSLFYDGYYFAWATEFTTVGDNKISGYNNYGRGITDHLFDAGPIDTSHQQFGEKWVADTAQGLERAVGDIWAKKDPGTFYPDPVGEAFVVVAIFQDDIYGEFNVEIANGNLYIDGALIVGPVGAQVNLLAGKEGLEASLVVLVAAAQIKIRDGHIAASANVALANASADISQDGGNLQISVLGSGGDIVVGSGDVTVSGDVGGSNGVSVEIGTSGANVSVGGVTIISW